MDVILVSQWQENGDLNAFLNHLKARGEQPDFPKLFFGIAAGIEYLHSQIPPIIHGGLCGDNILIRADGSPCLPGGNFSKFHYNRDRTQTTSFAPFLFSGPRFCAPELLEDLRFTTLTDVYAFGLTLLEALSGDRPFHELETDLQVIIALAYGERPALPNPFPRLLSRYIHLIKQCWQEEKSARPGIDNIIAELDRIAVGLHNPIVPLAASTLKINGELEDGLGDLKTRLEHQLNLEVTIGRDLEETIPLTVGNFFSFIYTILTLSPYSCSDLSTMCIWGRVKSRNGKSHETMCIWKDLLTPSLFSISRAIKCY
ncbi:hypothetical protein BS47DRAFT_50843 [Hydnum rufescens UP504]|uniref:Protein kinase domain-containing protein n=1 Tax=Hydnum rufescens UP504 TaxID=1448309 RepID=A0A9P6AS59_9AGAM|nr:hypothetical protein BS47DRAFT_50843 [Hydnum rufescens UP504]